MSWSPCVRRGDAPGVAQPVGYGLGAGPGDYRLPPHVGLGHTGPEWGWCWGFLLVLSMGGGGGGRAWDGGLLEAA